MNWWWRWSAESGRVRPASVVWHWRWLVWENRWWFERRMEWIWSCAMVASLHRAHWWQRPNVATYRCRTSPVGQNGASERSQRFVIELWSVRTVNAPTAKAIYLLPMFKSASYEFPESTSCQVSYLSKSLRLQCAKLVHEGQS